MDKGQSARTVDHWIAVIPTASREYLETLVMAAVQTRIQQMTLEELRVYLLRLVKQMNG